VVLPARECRGACGDADGEQYDIDEVPGEGFIIHKQGG
jgi:hypothetical protein